MPGTPKLALHHYASSPFAEKVRLALGLKGLAWGSVEVAPQPPRPLLDALTGGHRRIPVLQVGADIYCDTNIILPALERLHPEPTLYPDAPTALVQALSFNWERSVWFAAIGGARADREGGRAGRVPARSQGGLPLLRHEQGGDGAAGRAQRAADAGAAGLADRAVGGRTIVSVG